MSKLTIGVLGLQGAIEEHEQATLGAASKKGVEVKIRTVLLPEDLEGLDGIIMPGGESTAMIKQGTKSGLLPTLRDFLERDLPAFGTCAGAILLSKRVKRDEGSSIIEGAFPILDITTLRNGYGRQKDSFTTHLEIKSISPQFEAVFIRAPIIEEAGNVEVLAKFKEKPTMVRHSNIIASTFHPELSESTAVHEFFLDLAKKYSKR